MPDTCKVPESFSNIIPECNDFYSWSEEERKDFSKGWSDPAQANLTESKNSDKEEFSLPWDHQSILEASSFPYMGKISSYRGGGFIVQLGPDKVTALNELTSLEANGWIDRYTRALFAELNIYNVNVNLLCVVTLLFEDLPTGGGETFVNVQTIRVFRYIGNFSAALMACEVMFAFLLLRWIFRDGKRLWKERKAFYKNVWNVFDVTITSLSVTAFALYFARLAFLKSAIDEIHENRSRFVSFQYVVLLNEGVNAMIAFVVLLLNLKFLRMLRFNRKISVLSTTMKVSASKLTNFMVIFLVIFLAYCFLVWLVFGAALEDYRSIIRCMVSMMAMVLGNFKFYDLVDVNRFIGPAVFFSFMVIFQFIIINMFIGILCESFNEVRTDAIKQSNEYEILQFMTNRIKAFVGLFVEPPIRPEYKWPKSELEKKVETIEEKAETTMYFMRNLCAEDVRQMKWFEPDKWSRKKSIVMSLVLNADAEIMENDLCDGVGAMNKIIEKYSENELDRMLLASRMRRQSSVISQIGASSVFYADNSEDSEIEEPVSEENDDDDDVGELKNKVSEESTDENRKKTEKEEKEKEEEEEELMEQIEAEFEEDDEDDENPERDAEKCGQVKWKQETELQVGSLGSLISRNSNGTVSLNEGESPSMPKSQRTTQGSIENIGSNVGDEEIRGSQTELSYSLASAATSTTATLKVETPSSTAPSTYDLQSVEVPVFKGNFGDCTTIFLKGADNDSIALKSHSEA